MYTGIPTTQDDSVAFDNKTRHAVPSVVDLDDQRGHYCETRDGLAVGKRSVASATTRQRAWLRDVQYRSTRNGDVVQNTVASWTIRSTGSGAAGHITYITRSAVFGFPDMTTVERRGNQIRMYARLRFGASDLGVNRKRLERVIATLQGG